MEKRSGMFSLININNILNTVAPTYVREREKISLAMSVTPASAAPFESFTPDYLESNTVTGTM
jgi:hypothetical protein